MAVQSNSIRYSSIQHTVLEYPNAYVDFFLVLISLFQVYANTKGAVHTFLQRQ